MHNMKRVLPRLSSLLLILFFSLSACEWTPSKRIIKAYYFPVDSLLDGLVYEYGPLHNDLGKEYWYYRTVDRDSNRYLSGQFYDQDYVVQQLFSEQVVENGTLIDSYFLYAYDSTEALTTARANIEVANSFPFEVSDSKGVFLFKMSWTDATQQDLKLRLIRNRRFMGDTTYQYKGESLDCIYFKTKELIESEKVGFQEIIYDGLEIYGRDLGLIYYKKDISPALSLEYELSDRYPMDTLSAQFKRILDTK